ncbi:hypothetical protein DPMN_015435 [Dreissena polymorpha]|uniref:Uncharacterized protein n=1 Tax=Dreissena polymorpha TaxID=45954 RepID=A0A9D4NBJ8_DREPO|nr:hypothetical protein DPMN_015435 [Dreissena polymorpha]
MARQRLMRAPHVEIDRFVIKEVQYQLEVNQCRNEEIIVKDNFGLVWPIMGGAPQVEIDLIVIRDVQNEEIIVKGNFGWAWPMWAGCPRVGNGAMHKVQYQLSESCRNEEIVVKGNFGLVWPIMGGAPQVEIDLIVIRDVQNEEIIVKGNFGWAWPMWAGCPRVGNGAMHKVQYQLSESCRNEEIVVKGNLGCAWPMWAGRPRIDRIVIREVQYQFEVNRQFWMGVAYYGRGAPGLVMGPCTVEIYLSVIREAQYQFEVNQCRNEEVNFQGSSANSVGGAGCQDGHTHINTISPLFLRKTWG